MCLVFLSSLPQGSLNIFYGMPAVTVPVPVVGGADELPPLPPPLATATPAITPMATLQTHHFLYQGVLVLFISSPVLDLVLSRKLLFFVSEEGVLMVLFVPVRASGGAFNLSRSGAFGTPCVAVFPAMSVA